MLGEADSDLLPPRSCSEHQGTQLHSAGNLFRQCVQITSPFCAFHLIKQLVSQLFFAFLCILEASNERIMANINDYGGAGTTAMQVYGLLY